ncbi:hypothetical protein GON01_14060 [Sphingomonas sp. MAH-20]|uniref:Uncharacterized protein n=1 Tax=Sphingomonas horti TaxID=2682842 RepID=A0A6I4J3P0_9SPHN|nr:MULTISPECIES: hypothetical protein [Sphingomonas]MBA2919022.1 hypothetical protein [Sphingomonas sp. CGMCC 1.13658]MVO79055.1 hypothetical protein [Sphingomonas horti]
MGLSLFLCVPAPAAVAPGVYDGSQTEMAARLVLRPDGKFAYALSYGALDEQAQGRWIEADGKLLLTTEPRPKPPRFAVVSDKPAADGGIHVALSDPDMLQGSSLTMVVTYAGASAPAFVEVDEDGRLPVPPGKTVAALVPDLPVFEQPLPAYALTPGGHMIVFRFEPNDLGIAAFDREPLAIDGDTLVLRRYDRTIRFEKDAN